MNRDERCTAAITIPVPDEPAMTGAAFVAQCEKRAGHRGKHRSEPTLLWAEPGD